MEQNETSRSEATLGGHVRADCRQTVTLAKTHALAELNPMLRWPAEYLVSGHREAEGLSQVDGLLLLLDLCSAILS